MQPTPQLTVRPVRPAHSVSSWLLLGFDTAAPQWETLFFFFFQMPWLLPSFLWTIKAPSAFPKQTDKTPTAHVWKIIARGVLGSWADLFLSFPLKGLVSLRTGLFAFFFFFVGPHPHLMEVTRLRVKLELQMPAYTTAHSSSGSLTHWARPGIELATLWFLVGFVATAPQRELLFAF